MPLLPLQFAVRSFQIDLLREGPWRLPGVETLARHYEEPLSRWLHFQNLVLSKKKYEAAVLQRAKGKRLFLLDERGSLWSTKEWIKAFEQALLKEKAWVFALGPPDGWSKGFLSHGEGLSLSPATLPHDLAGVVWLEQMYRVCACVKGTPYHRGSSG